MILHRVINIANSQAQENTNTFTLSENASIVSAIISLTLCYWLMYGKE